MSSALPVAPDANCCIPACEDEVVVNIAGPQGIPGAAATDGTDGTNAFTTTSADFTVPAELATVNITVANSSWAALSQVLYIQNAGWYRVTAIPDSTHLTVRNLEDTASGVYTENVAPATVIASGVKVGPGGLQGPAGAGAAGQLLAANNLSDVANPATARTNLGVAIGVNVQAYDADLTTYAGITPSANVQSVLAAANYAAIRALLSLVVGSNVQAWDAALDSVASGLTVAGLALIDDADAAAQRNTLDVLPGYGLLASSDAVNLNSAATDTAVTVNASRYLIDRITLENPSAAVTTATFGVFTAAGGGGTTLAADQALAATLTATTKIQHLTKQAIVDTDRRTEATLYLRVGTAEGAARTVNAKIYGWRFAA